MTEVSDIPRRFVSTLGRVDPVVWAITGAGLIWRWILILWIKPTCSEPSQSCFRLWGDALYYHSQGALLADGKGYVADHFMFDPELSQLVPSVDHPPVYSTLLGIWAALGLGGVTTQRLLSSGVGAFAILGLGVLAGRLGGRRAGWIAAAIAAVHPLLWINDIMLMSEAAYVPCIVAVLVVAYRIGPDSGVGSMVLLGVVVAVAGMARSEALLLFALMVPVLVLSKTDGAALRRVGLMCVAGLVGLATLAPWLIYNNLRFSEPILMTSSTGTVMMAGSCETAWSGPSRGYWANCMAERELWDAYEAEFPDLDPSIRVTEYDKSVTDAWQTERASEWYSANRDRIAGVVLARWGRSLDLYAVEHTLRINWQVEGRWRTPSTIGLIVYYALHPVALIGALRLRREGRSLAPLLALWVAVLIPSAITFGVTRYRVPIDVALILMGALGVDLALRGLAQLSGDDTPSADQQPIEPNGVPA